MGSSGLGFLAVEKPARGCLCLATTGIRLDEFPKEAAPRRLVTAELDK